MTHGAHLTTAGATSRQTKASILACVACAPALAAGTPALAMLLRQRDRMYYISPKMWRIVFFAFADKVKALHCDMQGSGGVRTTLLRSARSMPAGAL